MRVSSLGFAALCFRNKPHDYSTPRRPPPRTAVRGRNGGLKLAKAPGDINVGAVVRLTEKNFDMAECFDRDSNACRYHPGCSLKTVLSRATAAYLAELDKVTLVDLTVRKQLGVTRPVRFRAIA